jgi:hypothetical protein
VLSVGLAPQPACGTLWPDSPDLRVAREALSGSKPRSKTQQEATPRFLPLPACAVTWMGCKGEKVDPLRHVPGRRPLLSSIPLFPISQLSSNACTQYCGGPTAGTSLQPQSASTATGQRNGMNSIVSARRIARRTTVAQCPCISLPPPIPKHFRIGSCARPYHQQAHIPRSKGGSSLPACHRDIPAPNPTTPTPIVEAGPGP